MSPAIHIIGCEDLKQNVALIWQKDMFLCLQILSCSILFWQCTFVCDFQRINCVSLWLLQISVPDDYRLWYETMLAEFPTRFQRLFAGPMWSGAAKDDIRNPLKVRLDKRYQYRWWIHKQLRSHVIFPMLWSWWV